jgi:lipopolysaccharide transport system permease protein
VSTPETKPAIEIHIRPNQGWLNIDWKGLLDYRDLLFLLVRRDFVSRYQQTILGPIWFIINPLISALMNVLVLNVVIGVSTDGTPAMLFFLSGQITWGYFSSILDSTGNTFISNAHLFGKVYFPRLIVPLAQALSNLINFGIQLAAFLAIWGWLKIHPPAHSSFALDYSVLALFPLFIVHMAVLGLGAGMVISAFTVKYRDFRYLTSFLQQIWMMASAVWYPLSILFSKLPEKWHWLIVLNPMASIIEGSRRAFLGAGTFVPAYYAISAGITLVIFVVGLMLFQRSARTFVDTI